jgi:type I restriction enzyme R subunit
MRDVKSRNYFEQMKGRGTRVIQLDDLRKVTPSANYSKDHFVIVDAVGVTKSLKTDSRPLEKKPGVPLKDLLLAVTVGARDEELFTSLANRLIRLDKQLSEKEREQFVQKTNGKTISQVAKELLNAYNPDTVEDIRLHVQHEKPGDAPDTIEKEIQDKQSELIELAASTFHGELNTYIENVRRAHEQIIDTVNPDAVEFAGWDEQKKENALALIQDFREWIDQHKNEITALQIFYSQPYRRRELTYKMIKELFEALKADKPMLAPLRIWNAYKSVAALPVAERSRSNRSGSLNELSALVSLVRNVIGIDEVLTPYDKIVDRNFQSWVFSKQAGTLKFNDEQMQWLRMIKDYVASSFHIEKEDFDLNPFNAQGGLGRMWQLFGDSTDKIIEELNEVLAA